LRWPWNILLLEFADFNVYTSNMMNKDNGVNIKKTKRAYHHGDLRSALIADGLLMLKEGNVESFSLREVARRVGVSATAVYRHFPDKESLLSAMAQDGAEQLGQMQRQGVDEAGGGMAGFEVAGQTYVRFALANPALFRLMMGKRPVRPYFETECEGTDAALTHNSAMAVLLSSVSELSGDAAGAEAKKRRAIHAWSMVHGMAILMLDGLIPADEATILSIRRDAFG
jgi:AcrR family transcriptional regulator